jgi:hypothetical protein
LVFAAGVIALTAFATWAFALDRQALWSVVNACVADHKLTRAPFPCLKVDLGGGKERGYVVLYAPFERDTILAPTRKIVGVEDPYLQSSAAPNYFADAWEAWLNLNGERGRTPDLGFALVVNSALARSQDQLHIHMGCLAPSARSALDAARPGSRSANGRRSGLLFRTSLSGPSGPERRIWDRGRTIAERTAIVSKGRKARLRRWPREGPELASKPSFHASAKWPSAPEADVRCPLKDSDSVLTHPPAESSQSAAPTQGM